jgi:hypothetical protein
LWDLADEYLLSTCGGASSYGSDCVSPDLDHYYQLLTAALIAIAVLVPVGGWKVVMSLYDGWRLIGKEPSSLRRADET